MDVYARLYCTDCETRTLQMSEGQLSFSCTRCSSANMMDVEEESSLKDEQVKKLDKRSTS